MSTRTGIGFTTTRSGVDLIPLPESIIYTVSSFQPDPSFYENRSKFNNRAQTLEIPGQAWSGSLTTSRNLRDCCNKENDDQFRDLDVFLMKLRGNAGRFALSDPTWKSKCGSLGKGLKSATVTKYLPPIDGIAHYPTNNHYPAVSHYPTAGKFLEYRFTLTASYDFSGGLTLSEDAEFGATSIKVGSISGGITITNSNEWKHSLGVRPGYDEAYASAVEELKGKINFDAANELLLRADYIQIADQLVKMVQDFKVGDTEIHFEPPLRHPTSAGLEIEYKHPTAVMKLTKKYTQSNGPCGVYNPMTIEFEEAIE